MSTIPDWLTITGLTLLAGLAIPAGALLAKVEHLQPQWLERELRHSIIAFGGGALLAAVALVLIPEGSEGQSTLFTIGWFAAGALCFMLLDRWLASRKGNMSQLVAMLSDFFPEALALGAAFASQQNTAILLALIMTLQNLPEGFNAFREIQQSTQMKSVPILGVFVALALLGPIAGLSGYFWLSEYPDAVAAVMLFAGGGILYLIFQDIAPQAKLEKHWAPPLGAIAGFALGMLGDMLTR